MQRLDAREGRFDYFLGGLTGLSRKLPAAEICRRRRTSFTFPLLILTSGQTATVRGSISMSRPQNTTAAIAPRSLVSTSL